MLSKTLQKLIDIESVSGNERVLADFVENYLKNLDYLQVFRIGNCVIAKTNLSKNKRIILAGHLDTVPISKKTNNFPSTTTEKDGEIWVFGRGAVDMKGGDAVFLALSSYLSQNLDALKYDITFIFYDNEEVDASLNGLGKLAKSHPELLKGDFAILGEPSNSAVEAGCNGTIRFDINVLGRAAHSARAWSGENAIHKTTKVLEILNDWNNETHRVEVEGLHYIEGLNAVKIEGGIATNIIPDNCKIHINYRFAPDKTLQEAKSYLQELFHYHEIEFVDESPAARPGTALVEVQEFAALVKDIAGADIEPKYGWTDVARFSELGVPALNFGPGDPVLCHTDNEGLPVGSLQTAYEVLVKFFTNGK